MALETEYTPFEDAILKAQQFGLNLLVYTQVCSLIEKQNECALGALDPELPSSVKVQALNEAAGTFEALLIVAQVRENAGISA